tara:strand:- start:1015 stop:2190 length:1176 start_codon:yes stop_codon:yes gene_type:complete
MKVLHYTYSCLPISETFVRDLYLSISNKSDIETKICTHKLIKNKLTETLEVENFAFQHLPSLIKKVVNLKNLVLGKQANINYKKGQKEIKKFNPDVVHCHFAVAAWYYYHLTEGLKYDYPLLISCHGYDVFNLSDKNSGYYKVIKKISAKNTIFTCPSHFLKDQLVKKLDIDHSMVKVVPNGFNTDIFTTSNFSPPNGNVFRIAHCGRFIDLKGQFFLIQAISTLYQSGYNNIELTLIGDGETKNDLELLVYDLGLNHVVKFTGAVSHQKVGELIRQCDLYVHPSYTLESGHAETFGIAILEAIASGKPCIVTDSGGMKEIFNRQEQTFYKIVEQKSPESLANAIRYFLEFIPNIRVADFHHFQHEVLNNNNLTITTDKIIECYNKLLTIR